MRPIKAVAESTGLVIEHDGKEDSPAAITLGHLYARIVDPEHSNEFGAIYRVYWARDWWKLYVSADGAIPMDVVITPSVRHIGREQLGAILPDGWAIEQSLNCYTAFMGEQTSLPPCHSLLEAISSIRAFLSISASSAAADLTKSYAAELSEAGRVALEVQTKMEF
jgi:hypothetical protein